MVKYQPNLHILFSLLLFFLMGWGQTAFTQHVLSIDTKGKIKRIHYYTGDDIKLKLISTEKVNGRIDAIYDSSIVVHGRKILLTEVVTIYSSRPAFKYLGAIFVIGGVFYTGIDILNNAITPENNYVFSQNTLVIAGTSVGVGLILSYFGTKRIKVYNKGTLKIFNTTMIPVQRDSSQVNDTTKYCENGVEATLSKLNLDGCNWVIFLPNGEKLEPMNVYDFLTETQIEDGKPLKIRVEYYETKSASICMVGKTVAISCWEVLNE